MENILIFTKYLAKILKIKHKKNYNLFKLKTFLYN